MPRGAAPGERRGGRERGTKNKTTIEKERLAAEIAKHTVADARTHGKKLAKEVLDEFMITLAGMAAHYQPVPTGQPIPPGREPNDAKFKEYAELTIYCAKALAPYQSPTFKAMSVTMTPELPPARPGDNAKVIDLSDAKTVTRTYLTMVKAG